MNESRPDAAAQARKLSKELGVMLHADTCQRLFGGPCFCELHQEALRRDRILSVLTAATAAQEAELAEAKRDISAHMEAGGELVGTVRALREQVAAQEAEIARLKGQLDAAEQHVKILQKQRERDLPILQPTRLDLGL